MSKPAQYLLYLPQAANKLAAALGENLLGVVLYGSHARGEAREDSDVDLLVIARDLPERRYDRAVFLQRLARGIEDAPPFSLLGKTPEEFEHYFPSLYLDIGLDGVVLFDREGYTDGKLKRIREIIAEAGLVRERLEGGDMFWNWNRKTARQWEITWEGYRELA
jgi:predicted nucleotidyltransferase